MSLCLKNLAIHRSNGEALFPQVNLTIEKGEVLTLMGPSGCGKSTLLSVVAGHLSNEFNYRGEILLEGKSVDSLPAHLREIGILFQDDMLFPHLTVWENLAFALPNSIAKNERKEKALECLNTLSLPKIANSYPEQISGGQRARVSLSRMLLANPKLVLLDEPFSKLDKDLRIQFRDWVFEQMRNANIPALMVTHDEADIPPNSKTLTWPWTE
ncbi:ATP-binding cassette domain-containing protein [Vibrio makurazakiensis]|uniref:ATP-binding cassette domain-containing protein n=1 Tax=Vibrio makurazakiensis TaxID=2910250 RepID=UPI003D0FEBF3